jgi:hypothetical protein
LNTKARIAQRQIESKDIEMLQAKVRSFLIPAIFMVAGCQNIHSNTPHAALPKLNEKAFLTLIGTGIQIYRCDSDANNTARWQFQHPTAQLKNPSGAVIVDHGAGPSWSAKDGSKIVGKVIASTPSPDSGNIAWLQLSTTSAGSAGLLAQTKYIDRIDTKGGAPDPLACKVKDAGKLVQTPYTATYIFYRD